MDDAAAHTRRVSRLMRTPAEHVADLWKRYREAGPKNVGRDQFDPVDSASRGLLEQLENQDLLQTVCAATDTDPVAWRQRVTDAVTQARDLSYRCACTPQGLCLSRAKPA